MASHALGITLPLVNGMELYLDLSSPIVNLALTPGNGIFNLPFPGTLDSNGVVTGNLVIPNLPELVAFVLQLQFVVVDFSTGDIMVTSPAQKLEVLPAF